MLWSLSRWKRLWRWRSYEAWQKGVAADVIGLFGGIRPHTIEASPKGIAYDSSQRAVSPIQHQLSRARWLRCPDFVLLACLMQGPLNPAS